MRHSTLFFPLLILAVVFASCSQVQELNPESARIAQDNNTPSEAFAKKNPAIWAGCEAFATLGTNTSFDPDNGFFDELYNGANFMDGLGAVSESSPGDTDYNGGRWHVNTLKEGVDPDKYNDVCTIEGIDPDDFESTDTYFECPLRPIRGNSGS